MERRLRLMEWLLECAITHKQSVDTFILAAYLYDRYKASISHITMKEIQTIASACFTLASKWIEDRHEVICEDMQTDGITEGDVIKYEMTILQFFHWNVNVLTICDYLPWIKNTMLQFLIAASAFTSSFQKQKPETLCNSIHNLFLCLHYGKPISPDCTMLYNELIALPPFCKKRLGQKWSSFVHVLK